VPFEVVVGPSIFVVDELPQPPERNAATASTTASGTVERTDRTLPAMGRAAHARRSSVCHVARVTTDVDTGSLYSVRDVADRLGVHPETIRRLIHDGRLDAVRVGRVLRIEGRAVSGFVERQRVKPLRAR
jgi:excisionase family DNA binding protein